METVVAYLKRVPEFVWRERERPRFEPAALKKCQKHYEVRQLAPFNLYSLTRPAITEQESLSVVAWTTEHQAETSSVLASTASEIMQYKSQ
jgi:hypothetical protein